ncbi:hypothetical protein ACLOJK_018731, partial [Asimina triloba]
GHVAAIGIQKYCSFNCSMANVKSRKFKSNRDVQQLASSGALNDIRWAAIFEIANG